MSIKDIENKSFAFIEQNFNATFAELPEDLFKIWHITIPIETYLEGDYQNQYEFRIFLYALRKYEEIHGLRIPEETIPALFKTFQLMLSQRDTMLTQMYDIYFKIELLVWNFKDKVNAFSWFYKMKKDVCEDILFVDQLI